MRKLTLVFIALLTVLLVTGCPGTGQSTVQDTYRVIYDGNGADNGTPPTDSTAYEAGVSVTVYGNTGESCKWKLYFFWLELSA